jgi:excinuclease ABC subunit C
MSKLLLKAKKFPLSSGVYLFSDKKGEILYVGRAISLRKRILNYFQKNIDPRIAEMVRMAKDVKFQKTANLLEAIILEANLIKKYWPKYNVKEKDDRSFLYIVIPKGKFSKPIITRNRELKKFPSSSAHIFGPYQNYRLLSNALKIIRRIFPYSTCPINSGRPCFDYQIGLCPGACANKITAEDYQKNIDNIILLLKGDKKGLMKRLKAENPEQALALNHIQDVALIERSDFNNEKLGSKDIVKRLECYDISHLSGKEAVGSMVVFTNGLIDKSQYRLFKIKQAPANDDLRALEEVIGRRLNHKEWSYPDIIILDGGKPQVDYIFNFLSGHLINIPLVGISKLQNDKLVFSKNTKKSFKDLAEINKSTFLKMREEAHRFANAFRKKFSLI